MQKQLPNEGKSSEGDHNGQENFEEVEEAGSDEVLEGWSAADYPQVAAGFSLGSGRNPALRA
jgi:hypothetical protein